MTRDDGREMKDLEQGFYKQQSIKKADATVDSYRYHVGSFVDWVDDNGINPTDITQQTVLKYRDFRFDDHRSRTVRSQLNSIKVFLRYLASEGCISSEIPELVDIPEKQNSQRSDIVPEEDAERILDHLSKYEYASARHVIIQVLWDTGVRTGGLRGVDIDNVNLDRGTMTMRHRPAEDTPLKNKESAERTVSLRDETVSVVEDYIAENRIDATDQYGREPLITTSHGRPSRSWYREEVYSATRPCMVAQCPYGIEEDECPAAIRKNDASKCEGTVGPHAIRRGRITHLLRSDIPIDMISDRSDVGRKTIDNNYDERTESEKLEQRRDMLDDL